MRSSGLSTSRLCGVEWIELKPIYTSKTQFVFKPTETSLGTMENQKNQVASHTNVSFLSVEISYLYRKITRIVQFFFYNFAVWSGFPYGFWIGV
mmetsp:Transcript_12461/g.26386  ORF Transcript_12461/g.26386 Transcript_12461/m.26386 type:complete len:94 (+) Transcript_12461:131-412(+)